MTLHMNLEFHPGYQPPKESGTYLVISGEGGTMSAMEFSARHGKFNCHDSLPKPLYPMKVRWWAVLPTWMHWAGGKHPGRG